jgi:hypothetical protein
LTPSAELQLALPSLSKNDVSYLRNEHLHYFGWERLLLIAERLNVPVDIKVGEAA